MTWKGEADMHISIFSFKKQAERLVTVSLVACQFCDTFSGVGRWEGLLIRQTTSTQKGNSYVCSHQALVSENWRAKEFGVLRQPAITPHKPHALKTGGKKGNEWNNQHKTKSHYLQAREDSIKYWFSHIIWGWGEMTPERHQKDRHVFLILKEHHSPYKSNDFLT